MVTLFLYIKMENIDFNYSLKNTPAPSGSSYQLKLIDQNESVIKRMKWKAFLFLKDNNSMKPRNKHLVLNPNTTRAKRRNAIFQNVFTRYD